MTITKFFAAIVAIASLFGGIAITIKLIFGVWIPKGTPKWLVFWIPIVGVLLAILMFPATLRSIDESFDKGTELYEKVSERFGFGNKQPRPTPYATVCTPEGGWRSAVEVMESVEKSGVKISSHARNFFIGSDLRLSRRKRCYDLVLRVTNGPLTTAVSESNRVSACSGEAYAAFLVSKIGDTSLIGVTDFKLNQIVFSGGTVIYGHNTRELGKVAFEDVDRGPHLFCIY